MMMKSLALRSLTLLVVGLTAFSATAQEPTAAAPSPTEKPPLEQAFSTLMEHARDRDYPREQLFEDTLAYGLAFPEDPRRLGSAFSMIPKLAREVPDEQRVAFEQARDQRIAAVLAETLPDDVWETLLAVNVVIALNPVGVEPDLARVRERLDVLAAKFPQSGNRAMLEMEVAKRLAQTDAAAAIAHLQQVAAETTPEMRTHVEGVIRQLEATATAMSLKFIAADGRPVDLQQLRGKVVLIDFWATWCGPCIAELPNVKRVYEAYHEQGFEVIGITLENPGIGPRDSAEQQATKLERAKAKMLAFVAEHEMPWPQYFDGKWWKNEIATDLGIRAIPAMFLLDQTGKVVTTNARGEALEAEVVRLLGQ